MRFGVKSLLLGASLVGAALAAVPRPSSERRQSRSCNGSPELCDRVYSNVTFVGAHDSAFVGDFVTQNQHKSVADQLGLGIRYLQAQTHSWNNGIEMCHTSCIELDAGSLKTYLTPIKTFLDANADEVVTLLLTNGDDITVSDFGDVFVDVGLDTYAYAPSGTIALADWPTLGSLIDSGKRLIVFMDYHANTSSVNYILDEFTYYFETPYDTTDENFPQCTIDRPSGASADGRMGIVNHFLDYEFDLFGEKILIPYELKAGTTNSVSSITAQTDICLSSYGRVPNVVLLDYVDKGAPIDAQNQLNGL